MKSFERPSDLSAVRISLASPEQILSVSHGQVTNRKSIHYKTMNPERGGLFCEVIFGPLKDYECRCGTLQGFAYQGKVCPSCGVEVNSSRVRRYRMGHIRLASPIAHLWFLKVRPFYLNTFLGLKFHELEEILTTPKEVIFEIRQKIFPGKKPWQSLRHTSSSFPTRFQGSGHDVLYAYLQSMDLPQEFLYQRQLLFLPTPVSSTLSYASFLESNLFLQELKRFKMVCSFLVQQARPEWMMLTVLPVLPPELRPFLVMPNHLMISSDLNLLYKKILDRNQRLASLQHLTREYGSSFASSSFVQNELKMLQHAVDCLIENGRRGKPFLNSKRLPFKSLAHILKGKEGRFRMNLLGKRVDLSARTVISVGPRLKLTQCGLPLSMALNLFQSFLFRKLPSSFTKKSALWRKGSYENTQELLLHAERLLSHHPVLLNRAPTLHRMNVQAFQPVLLNTKAIQFHPLVCSSFNADFDGDQMAVHVPLSLSSQIESRLLMMTYNNIISPSNGSVLLTPSQDVLFGLYYATLSWSGTPSHSFTEVAQIRQAISQKQISLHSPILYQVSKSWKSTTPGRVLLSQIFPMIPFDRLNTVMVKKKLQDLIRLAYDSTILSELLFCLDQMTAFGFYYAHQAGISMSLHDVMVPSRKSKIVQQAHQQRLRQEENSSMVQVWSKAQEQLTSILLQDVQKGQFGQIPPLFMLIYSGARGSLLQMRQLCGLRGLMVKPSGELIQMPIVANFKEGLKVLEYFHSTHGSRKGVIDTSIRTATSGYLTRRLVHASQNILTTEFDCGTSLGIEIRTEYRDGKEVQSLASQAWGRTLAQDALDPRDQQLLFPRQTLLTHAHLATLQKHGVESLFVRSAFTCQASTGICQQCYGMQFSMSKRVPLGEAVGILASQSIGEPGTQLTMRTFHMGGVLQGGTDSNFFRAPESGRLYFKMERLWSSPEKMDVSINFSRSMEMFLLDEEDRILSRYDVPYGALLSVQDGQWVSKSDLLFQWNSLYEPLYYLSARPSVALCQDFVEGKTIESTQQGSRILARQEHDLFPRLMFLDSEGKIQKSWVSYQGRRWKVSQVYFFQEEDLCQVVSGQVCQMGTLLGWIPRPSQGNVDITGGLSKISQLFECSFSSGKKNKMATESMLAWCTPSRGTKKVRWSLQKSNAENPEYGSEETKWTFRSFSFFRKGDSLSVGVPSYEELLSFWGTGRTLNRFKKEIQSIYQANGVNIHEKHFEMMLNRMLSRVRVEDAGQTSLVPQEEVSREDFVWKNVESLAKGLRMAKGEVKMKGITHISLESSSFLSAASFQNTSLVLTKSAMQGKMDPLLGLSENVMVGRLCPMGTGVYSCMPRDPMKKEEYGNHSSIGEASAKGSHPNQ